MPALGQCAVSPNMHIHIYKYFSLMKLMLERRHSGWDVIELRLVGEGDMHFVCTENVTPGPSLEDTNSQHLAMEQP